MVTNRVASVVLATLLAGTIAHAAEPDTADAPLTPAERDSAQRFAQVLNPEGYPPALLIGAQAEVVGVQAGVSSLVVGYDWVRVQVELSAGMAVGGDPLEGVNPPDAYSFGVRVAMPIHRGIRADFALVAGGGAAFITAPAHNTLGFGLLGARFRLFLSPTVATVATLGAAALVGEEKATVVVGARPLGAAGVVYFFR